MKELTFKKREVANVVSILKLHDAISIIEKTDDYLFSFAGNNSTAKDIIEAFISDADDKHKDSLRSVLAFDALDDDRDVDEICIFFDTEYATDYYKFEYNKHDDGSIAISIIEEYNKVIVK